MAGIDSTLKSVGGWAKSVVDLGLSLIVVLLVVDIIFGDITGIIANVSATVGAFTGNGVVGFIALLFFLSIYKD